MQLYARMSPKVKNENTIKMQILKNANIKKCKYKKINIEIRIK